MVGKYLFRNNATSRLRIATPAASSTITVPSGEGARFPLPVAPDFFMATLDDRRTGQVEIVKCTARSADVITVIRAQEGTTAQTFALGALFSNRITAGTLDNFLESALSLTGYSKEEADARFVNVIGDTMTGPLALPAAAPTLGPQATNKTYVDAQILTRAATVHTHVIADTTGLQTALNGKVPEAPADSKPYGRMNSAWVDIRTLTTPTWASITGKPSTFPPSAHTHVISEVTNLQTTLDTKIAEAPDDGKTYGRLSKGWAQVGVATDAPSNGTIYGRKNAAWVPAAGAAAISDTAPASGDVGTFWWHSMTGMLYIRYQDADSLQWVAAALPSPPGPAGADGPAGPAGPAGPEGPAGPAGGGLTQAQADGFYVNVAGDTMTGTLVLPAGVTGAASLRIPQGTAPSAPVNGDMWSTSNYLTMRINGISKSFALRTEDSAFSAKQTFVASTAGSASLRLAPGVAVTSPADGDEWYVTAQNPYVRIGSVTKQFAMVSDTPQPLAHQLVKVSSAVNQIDFVIPAGASMVRFSGSVMPTVADATLMAFVQEGGTWINAAGSYVFGFAINSGPSTAAAVWSASSSTSATYMQVTYASSIGFPSPFQGVFTVGSATKRAHIMSTFSAYSSVTAGISENFGQFSALRTASAVSQGLRFMFSGGNIDVGSILLCEAF